MYRTWEELTLGRTTLLAITCLVMAGSTTGALWSQSVQTPNKQSAKVLVLQRQLAEQREYLADFEVQKKAYETLLARLSEDSDRLQKQQDQQGVSTDSFPEILKYLQAQRVELLIDLAGMNARREVVFELKKDMTVDSDSIVAQLEELLKLEEEELVRVQKLYKSSEITKSHYQKIQSRILELKIRMAEAKRPQKSASLLNDELLNSSLDRAEKKARLEKINSLLVTFTEARSTLEQSAEIERKIRNTNKSMSIAESRIANAKDMIDQLTKQLAKWTKPESRSDVDDQ